MTSIDQQCGRCNKTLPIECFEQKKFVVNEYYKQCKMCSTKRKAARDKSKCSHGRERMKCPDCDGPNICVKRNTYLIVLNVVEILFALTTRENPNAKNVI